ncbi:MAG TPA: glutathione S-transferase N-terminal domain-containing protein [Thermoanaerobaculia bacterium]|nr:glutathione S-transferase N-terminal domain-containing protein [Thermoanaerobaculia bacterium]
MLDLYYWPTPNGWKVTIFLEEAGLEYRVRPVNIGQGEQFEAEFLGISPNNKIPALVDSDGPDGAPIALFESGCILWYLAEKTGRFLPADPRRRYNVLQWLMFQVGHVGPMLGQAHHFRMYAEDKLQYAIDRYSNEAKRLYAVLDGQLSGNEYVAGDYSIADMMIFPWLVPYKRQGIELGDYPNVRRWFDVMKDRPGVRRGIEVGKELRQPDGIPMDAKSRDALFGAKQWQRGR